MGTLEHTEETQDLDAFAKIISILKPLADDDRRRVLESAAKFLNIQLVHAGNKISYADQEAGSVTVGPSFSEDRSMSPKDFLLDKLPRTDVERIACLAFYLTHYRNMPHFKTLDLSKLNTEAAQPKFSNAAYATENAVKQGFLVPATRGNKQLSAAGEQFVRSLPDRTAAKLAMASLRPRKMLRRKQPFSTKKPTSE